MLAQTKAAIGSWCRPTEDALVDEAYLKDDGGVSGAVNGAVSGALNGALNGALKLSLTQ